MKKISINRMGCLVFILTIVLFLPVSHAAIYTGADLLSLPGGGTLLITEDSTLIISSSEIIDASGWTVKVEADYKVDFLNQGALGGSIFFDTSNSAECNFTNQGSITGNFNISNVGGEFNFLNQGSFGGNYGLNNSGDGIVNLVNSSVMGGNFNSQTYGANTNITNDGSLSGNLYINDQLDVTNFSNTGIISGANIAFVANGDLGLINFNNSGLLTESTSSLDSNYGGHIVFQNVFGSADFTLLQIEANGWSHGVESLVEVFYTDLEVDTLNVYDETDAGFLATGLDRTFLGDTSGRVVFDYVSGGSSPISEPITLLLVGLGLLGVLGIRRKM